MQENTLTRLIWSAAISGGVTITFFLLQHGLGLNIWDEGFLWYGVKRTIHGEIPIRDFQAYEPGRYYWLAFWALLFGPQKILGVRIGCAILQWLSLTVGLQTFSPLIRSRVALSVLAVCLSLWMAPPYLIFERAIVLLTCSWCVYSLSRPSRSTAFYSGVVLGLLWLAGRNMSLYGLATALILTGYILYSRRPSFVECKKCFLLFILGTFVGSIPAFCFLFLVPGFLSVYWDTVVVDALHSRATNLFIPIPWPWTISWDWSTPTGVNQIAVSCCFLLFPLIALVGTAVALRNAWRPSSTRQFILVGILGIVMPWLHYPYSRADIYHLAPLGAPVMILIVTIFSGYSKPWIPWLGAIAVVILSCLAPSVLQPYLAQRIYAQEATHPYQVGSETLVLESGQGDLITNVTNVYNRLKRPDESALITPYYPGLYAVLDIRSPIYESFSILHARPAKQQEMIRDMELHNTQLVFYWELFVDNDPTLGFANTHPEVWHYIQEHFHSIEDPEFSGKYKVFRRNSST